MPWSTTLVSLSPPLPPLCPHSLLLSTGQDCVDSFTSAAEAVASLYSEGVGSAGYQQLDADFVTCEPMQSTKDLSILLSDLMGNVQVRPSLSGLLLFLSHRNHREPLNTMDRRTV
jgi:hypothetical protein